MSVARSLVERLRDEREREQAPGEVDVLREEEHRLADNREVAGQARELVDGGAELHPSLLRVELDCKALHGDVVHGELAVEVAAGRAYRDRTPPRGVELLGLEVDA